MFTWLCLIAKPCEYSRRQSLVEPEAEYSDANHPSESHPHGRSTIMPELSYDLLFTQARVFNEERLRFQPDEYIADLEERIERFGAAGSDED